MIAVVNQKGGVGKTSVTANVSALAAEAGARVLAIDADPQYALTRQLLDVPTEQQTMLGLGDVLRQEQSIPDVVVRATGADLHLVRASRDLAAAEIGLTSATRREERLARALVKVDGYDFVFIDCPPNLGLLTVNALAACDRVLIPVSAEDEGAVKGVGEVLLTLSEVYGDQEQPPVDAVLTKWNKQRETAVAVDEALRHFDAQVTVLKSRAAALALNHKAPVHRVPAVMIEKAKAQERAAVRKTYTRIARELGFLPQAVR